MPLRKLQDHRIDRQRLASFRALLLAADLDLELAFEQCARSDISVKSGGAQSGIPPWQEADGDGPRPPQCICRR